MSIVTRRSALCLLVACLGAVAPLTAREYNMAQGQLLRVDASAHKLVIRTEQGSQLQCTFNGDTRVTGVSSDIAALQTMTRLTVHYAKDQMEYVATAIEVHAGPF